VPEILTDEWLAACNAALASTPRDPAVRLAVTELVPDAPEGRHRAVCLVADDQGLRLVAGEDPRSSAWLTVSMADVEALHTGALDPARALTEGRVRVRGDLRSVVEAASLLAEAHASLRG
jgi:hypothetical protein